MICKSSLLKMLFLPYRFVQITDFILIIVFTHYPMVHLKMSNMLKYAIQMARINIHDALRKISHSGVCVIEVLCSMKKSRIIMESFLMCLSYIITRIQLYGLIVIGLSQLKEYKLYILMV